MKFSDVRFTSVLEGLNGVQRLVLLTHNILLFAVKLVNILMLTVSGENSVKLLEGFS